LQHYTNSGMNSKICHCRKSHKTYWRTSENTSSVVRMFKFLFKKSIHFQDLFKAQHSTTPPISDPKNFSLTIFCRVSWLTENTYSTNHVLNFKTTESLTNTFHSLHARFSHRNDNYMIKMSHAAKQQCTFG